jgi:hypothetical protein
MKWNPFYLGTQTALYRPGCLAYRRDRLATSAGRCRLQGGFSLTPPIWPAGNRVGVQAMSG